jgi:ABC-type branched-subunit amino acid transport system substrate-binding protein
VYGRKIVWKYYDDAYNPAQSLQLTNKLVLEDHIFADLGALGTEHNQAIRPMLNQRKIPQILVSTGASYWGLQYKQFPWTIGWQPDYIVEGRAYGQWIARNAPNAKIAVFLQNDDYGKDYLRGLKIGLAKKKSLIVAEQALRDLPHELRVADLTTEGFGRGHVGADHDPNADGPRDQHCEGSQLEAWHHRHQLCRSDRLRHADDREDGRS